MGYIPNPQNEESTIGSWDFDPSRSYEPIGSNREITKLWEIHGDTRVFSPPAR